MLRITSATGYVEVGSKNSSYAHFGTNRAKYYFDKRIIVNEGIIGSYDEDLRFYTDISEERIRIHNDTGNVGINTTVAEGKFVIGGDGASAQIHLKRTNTNVTGAVGAINFTAADAHSVANIYALGDGNDEGAHLVFKTTSAAGENNPYGSSTLERLRITSTGVVQLNTTNNAHIRGGVYAKYTGASGNSANINTSNAEKVSWLQTNTEIFENGGFTNNATDVTVPFDGIYQVTFNGFVSGTGGGQRTNIRFRYRINGTDSDVDQSLNNYIRTYASHNESSVNFTAYLNLSSGDTVAISAIGETTVTNDVVLVKDKSSLFFHLVA